MIIDVLTQKYAPGCGRGQGIIEKKNILILLNGIIEWDYCEWPKKMIKEGEGEEEKVVEVSDTEFLGVNPELKPGNVFLYKGQVIAVDSPNTLVLVVSETGPKALTRIWEEHILPETDLRFNDYDSTEITWEAVSRKDVPDTYKSVRPEWAMWALWKERFVEGRGFLKGDEFCLKVEMESDNLVLPTTLYMMSRQMWYDPTWIMGDDQAKSIMQEVLAWFYESYDRISRPVEKDEK